MPSAALGEEEEGQEFPLFQNERYFSIWRVPGMMECWGKRERMVGTLNSSFCRWDVEKFGTEKFSGTGHERNSELREGMLEAPDVRFCTEYRFGNSIRGAEFFS